MPKALVVGALGVVRQANVKYLTTLPDWSWSESRRAPDFDTQAQFISCDVTDRIALRSALAGHPDISHVVFAALHEQPTGLVAGWSEADTVHTNVAMLANTLDALEEAVPSLRHFALMHGGKAYGYISGRHRASLRARPTPAPCGRILLRSGGPAARAPARQVAELDRVAAAGGSGLRHWRSIEYDPRGGVFAAISHELGIALRFPARSATSRILQRPAPGQGRALGGPSPAAANEIFNISNDDCFLLQQVFPRIAEVFSMPLCPAPSVAPPL